MHNCVAIVPCRAGSKGLPDKNFLILGSEKLYKIALDQALRCISEVIISSDKNLKKLPRPIRKEPIITPKIMHFGPGAFFLSLIHI